MAAAKTVAGGTKASVLIRRLRSAIWRHYGEQSLEAWQTWLRQLFRTPRLTPQVTEFIEVHVSYQAFRNPALRHGKEFAETLS